MMKSEFESLAGRNVTDEQYKAIETLYMSSNLEKAEFVKSIRTMLKLSLLVRFMNEALRRGWHFQITLHSHITLPYTY